MNDILQLFSIAGKINLDGAKKAERDLDSVERKGRGTASRLGGAAKKIGKAGLIIGGAMTGAATATFAMVNKVTSSFDDIAKGSARLGVSTDAYQEMDYWASQNGMSHENMEKIVGRFNQRLGQAVNGNEKYSSALQELGVNMDNVRDGTMNTEEAFADTIKRLSELESEQDQVNLATEIFGQRTARDLLPALQDGALSMEDAQKKAEELGIVIGEDTLREAEKFQDTWDDLKRSFTTFGQQIMSQLMPVFQTLMDWILDNMPIIQEIFSTVFDVVSGVFSTLVGWIQTAIEQFASFRESNTETFTQIWETIQENLTMVLEFWQEVWSTIREFWEETGEELLEFAILYFGQIWETVESIFLAIREIIEQIIGYIVPWLQDKLQVLQEFWEEHGETVMEAVTVMYETIREIIDVLMQSVQRILEVAWGFVEAIFDTAIGIILGIVQTFSSLITGDFEGLKDGLISIVEALWEGIKSIFATAWDMISEPLGILFDNISEWFTGLKDSAVEWGRGMIDGFIDGIKSMGENVAEAAKGVVDKAADFLKFWSPAKKGEGRFIRHWGRNMIDGFLDGVKDEEREAGRAMENIVKRMNPGSIDVGLNTVPGRQGVSGIGSQTIVQTAQTAGTTDELLKQLIETVKANKDVYIDGERVTGVINDVNAVDSVVRGYMG